MLTNFEKARIRIIVAQAARIAPDTVKVIEGEIENNSLYALDEFKGYNLILGFDKIPTIREAMEQIKDLYLCGVEWEFDEEMKSI